MGTILIFSERIAHIRFPLNRRLMTSKYRDGVHGLYNRTLQRSPGTECIRTPTITLKDRHSILAILPVRRTIDQKTAARESTIRQVLVSQATIPKP